jgi:hypothetical protein
MTEDSDSDNPIPPPFVQSDRPQKLPGRRDGPNAGEHGGQERREVGEHHGVTVDLPGRGEPRFVCLMQNFSIVQQRNDYISI